MSLDALLKAYNQTSESHIRLVTRAQHNNSEPLKDFVFEPLSASSDLGLIAPASEKQALQFFVQFLSAYEAPNPNDLWSYLTQSSADCPDLLKNIVTPLVFIGLPIVPQAESESLVTVLSSQTRLYWYHIDDQHFYALIENMPLLREILLALLDTIQNDFGIGTALFVMPPALSAETLRQSFSLLQTMIKSQVMNEGIMTIENCASDLVAILMLETRSPLFDFLPLSVLSEVLDDDLIKTAEIFLKYHLNITDTAKALYLHRNTLLYRLDKIQKTTGFDLRQFQDSWLFQLLLSFKKAKELNV